jgi:hypothetical protein
MIKVIYCLPPSTLSELYALWEVALLLRLGSWKGGGTYHITVNFINEINFRSHIQLWAAVFLTERPGRDGHQQGLEAWLNRYFLY